MLDKLKEGLNKAKSALHRPSGTIKREPGSSGAGIVYSSTSVATAYLATGSQNYPSALEALNDVSTAKTSEIDTPEPTPGPITQLTKSNVKHTVWAGIKTLLGVLNETSDSFAPLKLAISAISNCIEIFEAQAKARDDYKKLSDNLDLLCSDLCAYMTGPTPPSMTPIIGYISKGIQRELNIVSQKARRNMNERYTEATEDADEILECYQRIKILLERLTDLRLKDLSNSPAAKYRSTESTKVRRVGCTPNTRVELLRQLRAWAHDDSSEKVYWLNGMAGTGKTAIAYSLCEYLHSTSQLGASFFCSRQLPSCRDANRIMPSIAHQISLFSLPFRHALSKMLQEDKDLHNQPLQDQFKDLVASPLRKVAQTFPSCVVIVLDALDECEGNDGVDQMLDTLLAHASELPVKFFVTSRPEAKIVDQMRSHKEEGVRSELRLHELEHTIVQQDIRTYLAAALKSAEVSHTELDRLAEQSGVLFIYAATVVRYIEYDNFSRCTKRLKLVLDKSSSQSTKSAKDVDVLYTTILSAAFDDGALEDSERAEMAMILNTVVCTREPLSVDTIADLLGLDDPRLVQAALRPLLSVLNVSESSGLVTTLHESFPDYMLSQSRSHTFCCDKRKTDALIARRCFQLLKKFQQPSFNICRLESSYLFDKYIPDLGQRVERAVSKGLYYASRYWGDHLVHISGTVQLFEALLDLLSTRLLLWAEILNLKECLGEGAQMLYQIAVWCEDVICPNDLLSLARDAYSFVAMIASSPILQSTPHIYVSALRFWPESRPVSRYYIPRLSGLVSATGTSMERRREVATPITIHHRASAKAVSYSPDGKHVAVGSGSEISIWEGLTGRAVGHPLVGQKGHVTSVAYSSDGLQIVSGSSDKSLYIWDVNFMKLVQQWPEAHSDFVSSVAYSPDGAFIVSGSYDCTLRIWSSCNGQLVGEEMRHDSVVNSVTYSPNGAYVASSSNDKTIRIWDAATRRMAMQISTSSGSAILSVSYSPDGEQIVSGSDDGTICVWDVCNGQLARKPIMGHYQDVNNVLYFPRGNCVASCSDDGTICIWDVLTGQQIGQPLEGHTHSIYSIACSPNGAHLVSSSLDKTTRIWDVRTSQDEKQTYMSGHCGSVNSVAYSADGAYLVSGSNDGTACVWDAYTGQIKGKLKGHTSMVTTVACSPDGIHALSGSFSGTICTWDLRSMEKQRSYELGNSILSAAYSPDGAAFASGCYNGAIYISDAHTGELVRQLPQSKTPLGRVNEVIYSPNGVHIGSGSADTCVRLWDSHTGAMLYSQLIGHSDEVRAVAFSPDSTKIISGSFDATTCIWRVQSGELIMRLETINRLMSIAYSPDGAHIITGASDGVVRIWDAVTGVPITIPLKGHTHLVNSVVYSPDGQHIATGSEDGTIRIWNSPESRAVCDLPEYTNKREQTTICLTGTTGNSKTFWDIDDDGWLVNERSELLLWIPPDLRSAVVRPDCPIVISRFGDLRLDLDGANIGHNWQKCYSAHTSSSHAESVSNSFR